LVHTRIVRCPEVDQDPAIGRHGQITQHLGKLAGGEFARSTGAVGVVGQSSHNLAAGQGLRTEESGWPRSLAPSPVPL
jgi:hypothetical protein